MCFDCSTKKLKALKVDIILPWDLIKVKKTVYIFNINFMCLHKMSLLCTVDTLNKIYFHIWFFFHFPMEALQLAFAFSIS